MTSSEPLYPNQPARRGFAAWKTPAFHALPLTLFLLALFYTWFALADRYALFLYGHLGATPFDAVTSSRYWMAGLVAGGMVLVLYGAANWALARAAALRQRLYRPPAWWRVWLICAGPLAVGIPWISMTANQPTLPPGLALATTLASLVGLALALPAGSWAAERPGEMVWLALDGLALMPTLLLLRALELPARGLITRPYAYTVAFGSLAAGAFWLEVMTARRVWRRKPAPGAAALYVSGLCWSYLIMPLAHHLLFTPPAYRYITTATNFFALSPGLQLLAFGAAGGLAWGVTHLRRRL